jgi:hypothetical protein
MLILFGWTTHLSLNLNLTTVCVSFNGVCSLLPRVQTPYGQIDCFKTCLVTKGYTQIYGLDYGDTFSLVAKINYVCLFLGMDVIHHCHFISWTLKLSFYTKFEEEVYMDQPPDFTVLGNSRLVRRLHCFLYEMKQSPCASFSHFSYALMEFGMTRCKADHSFSSFVPPPVNASFLLSMLMTLLSPEMT